jgi:hypothetical protein
VTRSRLFFGAVLTLQLVVLYWPRAAQPSDGLPWDKLVHALIFGVVYAAGVRAGIPWRLWFVVSLVHAGVSEVLQDTLLPRRSGDPYDAAADAVGVLVAALAMTVAAARRRTAPVRSPDSADRAWHAE